jgi:hypothetical protein
MRGCVRYAIGTPDLINHLAEEIPRPAYNLPEAIAAQMALGFLALAASHNYRENVENRETRRQPLTSAKCLRVFEFSALNAGPILYTFFLPPAISICCRTVLIELGTLLFRSM